MQPGEAPRLPALGSLADHTMGRHDPRQCAQREKPRSHANPGSAQVSQPARRLATMMPVGHNQPRWEPSVIHQHGDRSPLHTRGNPLAQERVHALRNGLTSLVTLIGLELPDLLSGSLVIEVVFSWPGIGLLAYQRALGYDYTTVMGVTTFVAILVVLGNLLADLSYGILDPRVRYS